MGITPSNPSSWGEIFFRGVEILLNARLNATGRLFFPTDAGPIQCYACAERDAATCSANQFRQTCATDRNSLGTTHCGSAVGKYRDESGKVLDGFIRGCIDCAGKEK